MQLILFRHGPAGDRLKYKKTVGKPDRQRPLTENGQRVVAETAKLLRLNINKIDRICYSPYIRTRETAEILFDRFTDAHSQASEFLTPEGTNGEFLHALRSFSKDQVCLFVGHEPRMGEMLSFILTGGAHSFAVFKKGGFAIVDIPNEILAGRATSRATVRSINKKARLICLMSLSHTKKIKRT